MPEMIFSKDVAVVRRGSRMRFSPPTQLPAPAPAPAPASPPDRLWPRGIANWLRRRRPVTTLLAAGVAVVLLCFGVGLGTDVKLMPMGWGSDTGPPQAVEKADTKRAAEDKAVAQKVAAANAADAKAAAERAAEAEAARAEAARKQVVAMPVLVGLKLDEAMDVAAAAGLTAVTVCRTPDGDTPLWWPNWRITGQDVSPGTRTSADRQICVSATK
jgi:hypothetical protein